MKRSEVVERLRSCAEDPMWANHAEVSKNTLRLAVTMLSMPQPRPKPATTPPQAPGTPSQAPANARGRPPVPESARLRIGTIRLTQAQWDKLSALGGVTWLRKKIDASRPPLPQL